MGIWASRAWHRLFASDQDCKIVIVGLNNAGKTTILYNLHLGQVVLTQPTIGSNVEEVKHENLTFQVWDLGGQESLRANWSTYFEEADAIIFVVDSNDQENMVLAKMELFNVVLHEDLKHACLLVLANKQDIQGSRNAGQIAQDLSLHKILTHEWQIQSCCALTGEGLREGMSWIAGRIRAHRSGEASGPRSQQTVS
ncbi:ARL5A [Symbiodinium necroappetens]|uniref:ARL5A protein n=1 Tax=Symbiodinium necroappetens TaxID=1628268 RepID=A0A812MLD8_9DINO|nr:ARL5A [Symbiodinium necroappetens]